MTAAAFLPTVQPGVFFLLAALTAIAVTFAFLWWSERRPVDPWAPSRVETRARAVEEALSAGKRGAAR